MRIKLLSTALLSVAFTLPAVADQYTLTLNHCTGGCGTAPFGTIEVMADGANTVNVTATLSSGDAFVRTGFPGSFGFNVSGDPTITVNNLTPGWSLLSNTAGHDHFDGFGMFDYALICDACGSGSSKPFGGSLSFDVTSTGLTAASFLDLSTIPPGTESAYFVADILGRTGNTGPVGATLDPATTPEPGALLLSGLGGLSLTLFGLRRRVKA